MGIQLCACSTNTINYTSLKDGTYTSTQDGYGGEVKVTTTVVDGNVQDINVDGSYETQTYSDYACTQIPKEVMEHHTINIDTVTGATVTSNAILNGISDSLQQAGANMSEWQSAEKITIPEKTEEVETEVVVIGGGISGISAALRLNQLGIKTVLVEKEETVGGSFRYSFAQSQLYVDDENQSVHTLFQQYYDQNLGSSWQLLQDNLEVTVDWQISDLGVTFQENDTADQPYAVYKDKDGTLVELLQKEIAASNIVTYTTTYAYAVDKNEDGYVVNTMSSDGTKREMTCKNVVLANGASMDDISISVDIPTEHMTNTYTTAFGLSLDDGKVVDIYDGYQSSVEYGTLLVAEDGLRYVNETAYRHQQDALLDDSANYYLVLNEKGYEVLKKTILKHTNVSEEMASILKEDEIPGVMYGDTVSEAIAQTNIHESTLLSTIVDCYAYQEESAFDVFQRLDFNKIIKVDEPCYIVPLENMTYEMMESYVVDSSLRVSGDATNGMYAIGNASGSFMNGIEEDGLANAWAFTSGMYVGDTIANSDSAIE